MASDIDAMRVGFAGAGVMGSAIIGRLLAAGCDVRVWNRSPERIEALLARDARRALTPRELAEQSDVVILCLLDAAVVDTVVLGRDGIADAGKPLLIVDHSSISPDETTRISGEFIGRANGRWVDAPVSGGAEVASRGELTIMMGGDEVDIATVTPLLSCYAARMTHMGPVGAGQLTKLCNQIIVGTTMASIAEAMHFAALSGLDISRMPAALTGGMADSLPFRLLAPRMVSPSTSPLGYVESMLKDLETACRSSDERGVELPVLSAATALFRSAAHGGLSREDPSALYRLLCITHPARSGSARSPEDAST